VVLRGGGHVRGSSHHLGAMRSDLKTQDHASDPALELDDHSLVRSFCPYWFKPRETMRDAHVNLFRRISE
jgi:hypothetical protein